MLLHIRRVRRYSLVCLVVASVLLTAVVPAFARPDLESSTTDRIPAAELTTQVSMVYHVIAKGETLWSIAQMYGLTVTRLSELNNYPDPMALRPGQRLAITEGGTTLAHQVSHLVKLLWPLHGTLTSLFGPRWGKVHTGIDIATRYGSDIHAALGGIVDTAAWLKGYGRTVIIDHGDGWATLYAHASKLLVEKGEQVTPGETIAKVGSSGNSTGPHVHFEVRFGGKCLDPLKMLD